MTKLFDAYVVEMRALVARAQKLHDDLRALSVDEVGARQAKWEQIVEIEAALSRLLRPSRRLTLHPSAEQERRPA